MNGWTDNHNARSNMKHIKSIGGMAAVLTGTMLGAWGQDFRTDINPALTYYRAFLVTTATMSHDDSAYLDSAEDRSQPLPARFGTNVSGSDQQFQLVRQAAHSTVACDWGIDWSAGSETLLPQLARCKAVAQTAKLRARWELQHNEPAGAVDDLTAAFVLGRNSGSDGSLIAVLVQEAIQNIVATTVAENFGEFPPEALGKLAVAMQTAPPENTMASAMVTENNMHAVWFPTWIHGLQVKYAGDDTKVMAAIRTVFDYEGGDGEPSRHEDWLKLVAASGGTSEGFLKLAQDLQPLATQVSEAMALPEAQYEAITNQLNAALQTSANPLAQILLPVITKTRPREFGALENEAMVQAAIAYKLNGAAGLNSVMDPSGAGPFQLQRFMFNGVDRGFELKGADTGRGFPSVMIFVETGGPAFYVYGTKVGQPVTP
jgi:hypothetical protein